MNMKTSASITMAVGLMFLGRALANDVVPKRTDFTRYQAMLDHSPFAVATAVALPAATPSFAKDLYISNAARSPEGDLVTLASASDRNFKEYLSTKQPNEHGYAIANIEWSEHIGATKATISKDGQFASVSFNQALLATTPGSSAPGPMPGFVQPQPAPVQSQGQMPPGTLYSPNQMAVPGAVTKPTVPLTQPTPPPRVRGVIPRNPSAVSPRTAPAVAPALPPNNNAEDD
jgi:hypothetical protein